MYKRKPNPIYSSIPTNIRNQASQTESNWPLLIPPLLALIDDPSTTYKIKGCELLSMFLRIAPSQIVERTGLGEVFQNALMPCLLYLPTLTPEEESLQLLSAVYPTLIALVNARFVEDKDRASRTKTFDQLFRDGVFKGYAHAGENVKIAELLVQTITNLVNEMGTTSVKHLKVNGMECSLSIRSLTFDLSKYCLYSLG